MRVHGDLVVNMHFCGYVSFPVLCNVDLYSGKRSNKSVFIELNRTAASHYGVCIQAGCDIFWRRESLLQITLMATVLLGQIESYDSPQEEWPQYVKRLEQFFMVNEITGEVKAEKR